MLVQVVAVDAHEGPVYVADEDALYFTTPRPNVAIKRLALDGERFPVHPERVSVVRAEANMANGMTLDGAGHLVVCEQGTRSQPARVSRLDPHAGTVETIVDAWDGLALNSPNDVVVRGDGTLWFTDPSYGYLQGFRPEPAVGDRVYRWERGHLSVVADAFDKPNGLAFSPDEQTLYVTDSGAPRHVVAFDVLEDRRLAGPRRFAVVDGSPDGITVDREGRVYVSAADGVQVFNAGGDLIGGIDLPGAVNFTFGGPGDDVLFITTDTAIWAAKGV